jgi:fibronectin-binding autotransporter adhesin
MDTQLRRLKFGNLIFIGLLMILASASPSWAQIVVTTLADTGPGSLRAAIASANGNAGADVITFDPVIFPPPPAAPGVILLQSPLPNLNGTGDTIDGTGAGVILDGSNTPTSPATVGLRVRRSDVTIRGLTIQNFPGDGIRVETPPPPTTFTTVTGVVIDDNNLFANGSRGIRVTGGQGPTTAGGAGGGKTVAASITNNTVVDNVVGQILIIGNLNSTDDFGGHNVTAIIDGNTVRRSHQQFVAGGPGGTGIDISGGTGVGSNNVVTATISNNSIHRNFDHGIRVPGCSTGGSSGSNNTIYATIINNSVRENGFNGNPTSSRDGILVEGAVGDAADTTACAGNTVRFNIAGNDFGGNRSRNISVSGGTGSGHDLQGVISGNTAKNTVDGNGINVSGGLGANNHIHDVTVSENQVSDSFNNGISVSGGTGTINATVNNIAVLSNHVFNNGNHGIVASGGTDTLNAAITGIRIDGNRSTGNGNRGIQASTGSTNGAVNPTVSLVGITDNTSSSNADNGIFIGSGVPGSGATPVSGNRADRNGVDGIRVSSTGYVLSNNTASRNAGAGISALGNTNGGGNKATQNASCNTPGCF